MLKHPRCLQDCASVPAQIHTDRIQERGSWTSTRNNTTWDIAAASFLKLGHIRIPQNAANRTRT